ncbi:hypothetical protein HY522_00070 [bacterium]|nr:hypothetical protein [bacterium]
MEILSSFALNLRLGKVTMRQPEFINRASHSQLSLIFNAAAIMMRA